MIHPDFDNQLIGLKIGENKEFKITFDANNPSPEIAGKEVNFKVKIEKIRAKEVLPLDDEFAKKISKYGTLAEFTAELKVSLEMEKKEDAEADLKNTLTEEAIKNAEIDVPDAMIKWESNIMLEELKTSLLRSNLTLDDYLKGIKKTEQEVREEFKNPSTVRAKGKIVLKKIAELEKIVVTPEDIETEIRLIAESEGKSADEYRASLGQNGVEYIEDYLLRRKALDFLVENAEIK
jgi:trigger factor